MNLNKCSRCGCFFASATDVCPKCESKDKNDINHLTNFLNESDGNALFQLKIYLFLQVFL